MALRGLVGRRHLARQAGPALELGHTLARVLDEELLSVAPAPAVAAKDVGVLAGEDHEALVESLEVRRAEVRQRVGAAEEQRLGRRRELVVDLVEAVGRIHRDRAVLGGEPAGHVQRLPGMIVLVLGEAEAVLARVAERGPIEESGPRVHHVHHDQPDGAPDGGIRAVTLAEEVVARVDADRARDGPVDDQHHRRSAGAARRPVIRELGPAQPADRGVDDGKVLRPAAGHHRVDRRLLGGDARVAARNLAEGLLGAQPGRREHVGDGLLGGRNDGQAVGVPRGEVRLDQRGGIAGGVRHRQRSGAGVVMSGG